MRRAVHPCSVLWFVVALPACEAGRERPTEPGAGGIEGVGGTDAWDSEGSSSGEPACVSGTLQCECLPEGTCESGLVCDLGVCLPDSTDADPEPGGEPSDECGTLSVVYRDFHPTHDDFGCHMAGTRDWPGLVLDHLGDDGKPVYNPTPDPRPPDHQGTTQQITSAETFAQWYAATPEVNMEIVGELVLSDVGGGVFSYSSDAFYPLTGMGFGNETVPDWLGDVRDDRNGNFTTEIHTKFVYEPGQVFTFIGDDDVWVYVDGDLVVDIGGLHPTVEATIELDTLGLAPGETYTLDVFHAERCASGSRFRIDTTIECLQDVPVK